MGAQQFSFAPKFPPNAGFSSPNLVFLEGNFWTRKFFQQAKI